MLSPIRGSGAILPRLETAFLASHYLCRLAASPVGECDADLWEGGHILFPNGRAPHSESVSP